MLRRSALAVVAALLAVTGLAACGDESSPSGQETSVTPTDPPSSSTPSSSTPSTPSTPAPSGSEGPATAVSDLAKRLGIEPAGITVVSAEEVTWSDASLGCPEPGMMYAQVLMEGSRIVLEANGKQYEYHAAAGKAPFYCENPKPPVR